MILHQVEALAAAGVTDIVLAVNYRPEIMTAALKKVSQLSALPLDAPPFAREFKSPCSILTRL